VRRSPLGTLLAAAALAGCARSGDADDPEAILTLRRHDMVRDQIERPFGRGGVSDPRVLDAMRRVERHRFVPADVVDEAYGDHPLPIGHRQTISQPYIVAVMTELLAVSPGDKVLEIGTGSGYQAAVLAEVGARVFTIEIVPELGERATALLKQLGYADRVTCRVGDGYRGWPEEAPFDRVILTASPPELPQPLLDQLKPGGRLVSPVGDADQELVVVTKTADGRTERESVFPVRFVPMTGKAQEDG
jgi:protein-L-isoaspartate(D-aspartate) O-methyltransferase